jgi:putative colanic acid biosynthesis acetyltransferase WcaF
MKQTDLSKYNNAWYKPGAWKIKIALWHITNALFLINPLNPFSQLKVFLLRLFGAKIGKGVVIKQSVNIKYPWLLSIDDYTWVGERVWIDNLAQVTIGKNCCLSQGAMLLCGNHNYKKETFDLITGKIHIKQGAWIGAKSLVGPNVTVNENTVLSVASVATKDLDANSIYRGNPAVRIKARD